jgi:hypothetical protein
MSDYLIHYGVKGMKWGVRRQAQVSAGRGQNIASRGPASPEQRKARIKKAAKIGVAVAGTALAAYGAHKLHDKQVLQMANNYAKLYVEDSNYFKSVKDAKSNWGGSYRAMMNDIRGFSDHALERQKRAIAKEASRKSFQAAQNAYLQRNMSNASNKNTATIYKRGQGMIRRTPGNGTKLIANGQRGNKAEAAYQRTFLYQKQLDAAHRSGDLDSFSKYYKLRNDAFSKTGPITATERYTTDRFNIAAGRTYKPIKRLKKR